MSDSPRLHRVARLIARLPVVVLALAAFARPAAHAAEAPDEERPWIEVGAFAGLHLFSGESELGVPDEPLHPEHALAPMLGARVGLLFWRGLALELEAAVVSSSVTVDVPEVGDSLAIVLGWRAQLAYHLGRGRLRPFLLAGAGGLSIIDAEARVAEDTDLAVHAGGGLKIELAEHLALRFDARWMAVPSAASESVTSDFELLGGLAIALGGGPGDAPIERPARQIDSDADGVLDDIDRCLRDAEDRDGFEDEDGCPDLDNDADGNPDATDKCPQQREERNGIDDEDGCPDGDADSDGIMGSIDRCPDEKEDLDQYLDDDGCPDLDNDGDGVPDTADRCPGPQESWNGYQDDDGCPDQLPAKVRAFAGVIAGIEFDKGKDTIRKPSFPVLDRAVAVLAAYPDLKIEITGHTSDEGDHDENVELSRRRAESVKNYLVGRGILADRIQTVGYGPDRPLVEGKSARARARNRRIEFKIVVEGSATP